MLTRQLLDLDNDIGLADQLLAGFSSRFHGLLDAALNLTEKVSDPSLIDASDSASLSELSCAHPRSPLVYAVQSDSSSLKQKLTLREKSIFDLGRDASQGWHKWKSERTRAKLEQSNLVGFKRKHGASS